MNYINAKNYYSCFCIVIQKNGNNDRSDRKKYRLAPKKDRSVKTKKKVGRDRRDSGQEEGAAWILWVENCRKDAGAHCPLSRRAALCAGSPAVLKRAWARGMS